VVTNNPDMQTQFRMKRHSAPGAQPEEPEDDDGYCIFCAGTGEGQYDGASCSNCGGRGYQRKKVEFDE